MLTEDGFVKNVDRIIPKLHTLRLILVGGNYLPGLQPEYNVITLTPQFTAL